MNHNQSALALNSPYARRAVTAGAGKHNANRPLVLIVGQRPEEKVDRQPLTARRGRLQQLKRSVDESHVAVGRDDVDAVGLNRHSVLNLENRHAGVAPDQVGQNARMIRSQMLHQHKRHAGIRDSRHTGEE